MDLSGTIFFFFLKEILIYDFFLIDFMLYFAGADWIELDSVCWLDLMFGSLLFFICYWLSTRNKPWLRNFKGMWCAVKTPHRSEATYSANLRTLTKSNMCLLWSDGKTKEDGRNKGNASLFFPFICIVREKKCISYSLADQRVCWFPIWLCSDTFSHGHES